MQTIVTIDFDIIMAPSIEYYNNLLAKDKKLFEDPLMQVCNADLIHYTRLTKWITKKAKNIKFENIVFVKTHDQVINYIDDPDTFLINIDHHHDLGYKDSDTINCGNWVKYLLENKLISNYVWVNNSNSILPMEEFSNCNFEDFRKYDLNKIIPDKIIICFSEEWIPPQYKTLFYLWLDLISQVKDSRYEIIENN